MLKYFYKYKWFRNLSDKKFILVGQVDSTFDLYNKWIEESEYQIGDKIIDTHNAGCRMWCYCGNELNNKYSFVKIIDVGQQSISEFKCSHCNTIQYWIDGIIPGYLRCDKNGKISISEFKRSWIDGIIPGYLRCDKNGKI